MTVGSRTVCPLAATNAMSLRHLARVMLLAELGSVAQVADRLNCSPTAVTKSVLEIERLLDVSLFQRTGGDYRLTPEGEILGRRSRVAWDAYQKIWSGAGGPTRAQGQPISNKRAGCFLAAFEHRNLKEAAQDLSLTVSAVYGAVTALESFFCVELFERAQHGELIPTHFGYELARGLKLVRTEVRFAIEEIASVGSGPRGRVEIGTLPRVREFLLPRAINALLSEHPEVSVRVLDATGPSLLRGVLSGELDFIVGPIKPKSSQSGLVMEPLIADHFIAVAAKNHPLAGVALPSLQDAIENYGWILTLRGSISRQILRRVLAERGLDEPSQIVETNSFSLMKGLLFEGRWIALSTVAEFYREPELGQLTALNLHLPLGADPDAELPISILKRADTILPPAAQLALEQVRATGIAFKDELERARARMFHRLKTV